MNPTLPKRVVDEAYRRDPTAAASEYGAQFRTDIEQFLTTEVVEAAKRQTKLELPFLDSHHYVAFADPAGGGSDEFTLAIGHKEDTVCVVDVLRARKGKPAAIVAEYAALLTQYGIKRITADRYAGSWPSDEFARYGITCEPCGKSKSDLYLDALAALNSSRVELPPDERTANQFTQLERRTARGGRDSIDHPPGGHDDRANAAAGLVAALGAEAEAWTEDDWQLSEVSPDGEVVGDLDGPWRPADSIGGALRDLRDDDEAGWW